MTRIWTNCFNTVTIIYFPLVWQTRSTDNTCAQQYDNTRAWLIINNRCKYIEIGNVMFIQHKYVATQTYANGVRVLLFLLSIASTMKVNGAKCFPVAYTLKRSEVPAVHLNNAEVSRANAAKYGFYLDSKITWWKHIIKKSNKMHVLIKINKWLFWRKKSAPFPFLLTNKTRLHKSTTKPKWTNGIELWGYLLAPLGNKM